MRSLGKWTSVLEVDSDETRSHFFQEEFHCFCEVMDPKDVAAAVREQCGSKKFVFNRVDDTDSTRMSILLLSNCKRSALVPERGPKHSLQPVGQAQVDVICIVSHG